MLATIPLELIYTGSRLRPIGEAQVAALVDSIADVGLLNPVTVYQRKVVHGGISVDGYGLVAGAHRVEACKRLGHPEIVAHVVEMGELERQIAECDENLVASSLSPAERALFTARRKEAYEALHPETRHGANQHTRSVQDEHSSPASRFTADTAARTGKSEATIRRDASRGEEIEPLALGLVRGTDLDTGKFLDELKRIKPENQVAFVQRKLEAQKAAASVKDRKASVSAKIDRDVKGRAAAEVAEIIAEHVPGEWWDAVKANLYSAGAKNIADALSNITGESLMDRKFG